MKDRILSAIQRGLEKKKPEAFIEAFELFLDEREKQKEASMREFLKAEFQILRNEIQAAAERLEDKIEMVEKRFSDRLEMLEKRFLDRIEIQEKRLEEKISHCFRILLIAFFGVYLILNPAFFNFIKSMVQLFR